MNNYICTDISNNTKQNKTKKLSRVNINIKTIPMVATSRNTVSLASAYGDDSLFSVLNSVLNPTVPMTHICVFRHYIVWVTTDIECGREGGDEVRRGGGGAARRGV